VSKSYENTSVPVERSAAGIETLLRERGVTDTRVTRTASLAIIEFNWPIREKKAKCNGTYYSNACGNNKKHPAHIVYDVKHVLGVRMVAPWATDEREQRRIMRVLYWHLKTKLETVEAGVVTFAEEFMPHLTLGRGRRVWDEFAPRLAAAVARSEDMAIDLEGATVDTIQRALPEGERVQ
jgi:hypothetical protein